MRRFVYPLLTLVAIVALVAINPRHVRADERDFTLTNGSPTVTIVHVYVSPATTSDWEEDILGQDVLNPGEAVTIHFSRFDSASGQCAYDVRVDGVDGSQGFLYAVDLCSTTDVTFS